MKAVGLFYAILGGVLSIYFVQNPGRPERDIEVAKFLLYAPLIMSGILGVMFFYFARLWRIATAKVRDIIEGHGMKDVLKFDLLTWILVIFGLTFFATGAGLIWLIRQLT